MKHALSTRFTALAVALALLLVGMPAFAVTATCPLCGDADWTQVAPADWAAGKALTTGHYQLTGDIALSATLTVASGATVCIDLAGFDITASGSTTNSYRVFENNGTLTILDSAPTDGVISGGYMYAGTNLKDTFGGNIYNGAGSVFNLYGGTISGGTVHRKYHSTISYGGGNIYSEGTVNIIGGTVSGGTCYGNLAGGAGTTSKRQVLLSGGNLFVIGGELNISGGTVTGGTVNNISYGRSAPGTYQGYGGNICVSGTKLSISGGTVSDGSVAVNAQGVDSASGTAVDAKAYGGNIIAVSKSTITVTGGNITGGSAVASAAAYNNGTLTTKNIYPFGGSIYVSSNSSMTISAGTVSGGTAYQGGTVYASGKLTVTGGELSRGTAEAYEGASGNYGGVIFAVTDLSITGGTISSGTARRGGNIYGEKGIAVSGGTITSGTALDRGGNIGTNAGTITITGGIITEGEAESFGGNIWCADTLKLYDGTITAGNAGNGGNIALISAADGYIYGGTVDGGAGGYGVYLYDGTSAGPGNLYVYGGNIASLRMGLGGTNIVNLYNGTIGSIVNVKDQDISLASVDANKDGSAIVPSCAHITENKGYIFWHHIENCETCGHTYGTNTCAACETVHPTPVGGTHTYALTGEDGAAACIYCGLTLDGKVVASVAGTYYTDLAEALTAGEETGKTVKLEQDVTVDTLNLYCALDLNGHLITGNVSAENKDATLSDSLGTGGIAGSLYSHADNGQIGVLVDGVYKLETVALEQINETVSADEIFIKFIIADNAENTWLDDVIKTGDEVTLQLTVKWLEAGVEKSHTFRYTEELVKAYALNSQGESVWGEKMFTCRVFGLEVLGEYTITAELKACGVVVAAKDVTPPSNTSVYRFESGDGYAKVNDILSWEKINAIPVYHEGMTEAEIRDMIVAVHELSRNFVWVSNADLVYQALSTVNLHNLTDGAVYGGLPYMKQGTGNIYRTMDFMDPETGVINIAKAGLQPGLFGNMCSCSAWWGWARVVNSANYKYSTHATPFNGCIPLGNLVYDDTIPEFGAQQGTGTIVTDSGMEAVYEAYALAKKADGLVCNTPGSHIIMVYEDAHVVRNADGSINGSESYLNVIDQTTGWTTHTNEAGDTYKATGNICMKMTFKSLYNKSYVPFTFAELLGTDPIEKTEITFSHSGDTITAEQLFSSKVTCNYALSDVYAVFTDSRNNEVYRHAIRAAYPCMMELAITETSPAGDKDCVTTWGTMDSLVEGETYTVQIIAQIGTGERPVLWEGTFNK